VISAHLCLVSAQATPNITPVLDPATAPARLILLVSPDMERRAGWLERVLRPRAIKVERWPIEDAWDVEHVQTRVLELLERERDAIGRGSIALNATGGTKPMSIAAYETFRAYGLPIFYVHPEKDRLIWMHPGGRPAVDLENRVRLGSFLMAHGTRVASSKTDGVPEELRDLTASLVTDTRTYRRALGVLNWLANRAEGSLVSPPMESRQLHDEALQTLLDRFANAGILEVRGVRLRFPDEPARFYANGGWLEEHVYDILRARRAEAPHIQDLARSMEIVRETIRGDEVPNELDVVCLADNRLYLVECKTRAWKNTVSPDLGASALYRLDTLTDLLGGLQAKAMLVSYQALPGHVLRRAADLGVRVCAGTRLAELAADLRGWIA
jgi:hypothetical protein